MQYINKAIEYALNNIRFETVFVKQGLSHTYYQITCITMNNIKSEECYLTIDNLNYHIIVLSLKTLKTHIFYPDSLIIHLLQMSICIKDDLDIASSIYTINRNNKTPHTLTNNLQSADSNTFNIRISGFETIIDCRSVYIDFIEQISKNIYEPIPSLICFDEDIQKQPVCNIMFLQNHVHKSTLNLLETKIINHLLTMPYIYKCNNFSIIPSITLKTEIKDMLFTNPPLYNTLSEISILVLHNYKNQSQLLQTLLYYFVKSLMIFEIRQQPTICEHTYNRTCRSIIDSMNFHIINTNIIDDIRLSLFKVHHTFMINNISKITEGLTLLNSFNKDYDLLYKHFTDLGKYLHKLDSYQTTSLLYSFIIQASPLKSELKPLIPYIASKILSHEIKF